MGRIKEVYIELKREYKDFDEEDMPYLFEQYVKKHYPAMEEKDTLNVYMIHKSTACELLKGFYRNPEIFINIQLEELLERHYASKNRQYYVVNDDIDLVGYSIKNVNEF